jgi:hypothetical protein
MNRASTLWVLALAPTLSAQEPGTVQELRSGPRPGLPIPALPVYAPDGPDAGLELDLAAVIGQGPAAVLFVHELSRNVAPLVRGLEQLADSHAVLGLTTATVMLAADRGEAERRAPAASRSLRLARPMLVSVDGLEGPGAYALNRRATLTLVLCDRGQIVDSIAFTDTGRQDLPRLRELVERVTGPIPDSAGELRRLALERLPADPATLRARAAHLALELHWRALRSAEEEADRARRGADAAGAPARMAARGDAAPGDRAVPATRRGTAPTDDELRGLLRAAIQKDADAAALDATFAKIRARAAVSPELAREVEQMFELMLGLDYGSEDARRRAQAWLDGRKKQG